LQLCKTKQVNKARSHHGHQQHREHDQLVVCVAPRVLPHNRWNNAPVEGTLHVRLLRSFHRGAQDFDQNLEPTAQLTEENKHTA